MKKVRLYIVKLERGVWLAAWDGDPGRTCAPQLAKRFLERSEAEAALAAAREHRPFKKAKIVSI